MIELTQTINEASSYFNQAVNALTELFHSMEPCANDQGNTDTNSLAEWWDFCLEEYKEGYCKLLTTLAELEPYLKKDKFQYVSNEEDSDILTKAQYLVANDAIEHTINILSDLPLTYNLSNKVNLELLYLK